MADPATGFAPILTSRQRRHPVELPGDPTEEELARDWALSAEDREEALRCRGEASRLRFALQLCVVRHYGRFLDDYAGVSARILNFLSRQLDLPPVLAVEPSRREGTHQEHQRRIREYLGLKSFDLATQEQIERWVCGQAAEGLSPGEIFPHAEEALRLWDVILPARSTLERLVASQVARAQEEIFQRLTARLTPECRTDLDSLLEVGGDHPRSALLRLKEYPPEATAATILSYLEQYALLRSLQVERIDVSGLSPELTLQLAALVKRYDAWTLKRFAEPKRHAMLACFLTEAQKTVLDHLAEMHDRLLTKIWGRSQRAFEERHRELRRRAKEGLDQLVAAVEFLLDPCRSRETTLAELCRQVNEEELQAALASCRAFQHLEERGFVDEISSYYSYLRRYFPTLFELPFEAEPGSRSLLEALAIVRRLDRGELGKLPTSAPVDFVPPAWRKFLLRADGLLDRRAWEIALGFALRDALRSGDIYLPESRRHVSFWNLVYDERQWAQERSGAYKQLSLFPEADTVRRKLFQEFDLVARQLDQGLPQNPFVTLRDGELHLKRPDALEVPERIHRLRQTIETRLPRIRIEDLLRDVDKRCGFTQAFRPLPGYESRLENLYPTLLAAITAHATNLGTAAMAQSAEGITLEGLQEVSRWYLREATLKASNTALINYHHQSTLSGVWGSGTVSSSDGQRFGIQKNSLLASFYPRYFGYYDRAVSVYTHISDQFSVFSTRVISCAPREALYVLDGLLENDSVLRLREHSTDTHGYIEDLFGLCYLLGYSFMPRIRDLADQQLYRIDRDAVYPNLAGIFRGGVDVDLIPEQWDQLVRVAASLKNRVCPAHVVVQRLANSSPSDRLAKALTMLGRVVKTIYILKYFNEQDLRHRVQLQLNRGEHRHSLARWIFFADQGEFRTGDYQEIMNKASCLSLVSNAILVWNTLQIARIVETLRQTGTSIADDDLAHVSPLLHRHVIPNGTYHFPRAIEGGNLS
jgi:TnpA family transposase